MSRGCRVAVALLAVLAASLPVDAQNRVRPPGERLLIRCGLLIQPHGGTTLADAAILVGGGRILKVGRANEVGEPTGFRLVDYSGKYVIPGLIDTHAHTYVGVLKRRTMNELVPPFCLAAGVTAARSPGSMDPGGDLALRNRIDAGSLLGPRYYFAGEYLDAQPLKVGWMNPVATEEEVRLKIDHWASQGASAIKIYRSLSGDLFRTAVEHAHHWGLKATAHVGATTWREAIAAGVDELFHGLFEMPEARPAGLDPKDRWSWVADADLDAPLYADVLRAAAEARVVLTPTLVVFEGFEPAKQRLEEQRRFYSPAAWTEIATPPKRPARQDVWLKALAFVKRARAAGCLIATGTDLTYLSQVPGFSMWREIEILVEAGLTPMQALEAATWNGAYDLGASDMLGSLEAGKFADLVILDANPLDDISNVRRVHRVVKNGVIYDPAPIWSSLEGKVD